MKEQSPFSPGRPVSAEYFVGRLDEIKKIDRALRQSAKGRNQNIFVTGERGIGKSSLASFARYLAEREFQFLGVHCFMGAIKTVPEVCRMIFQRLLKESSGNGLFEKIKATLGKYISSVDMFGVSVELAQDEKALDSLYSNFLPLLREIMSSIKNERKGICLVLDDLNGISSMPEFAHFLKSLVDEIAVDVKNPTPLLLILAGTPDRMDDLRSHQPSISRIFDVVELSLLSKEEAGNFFQRSFESVGMLLHAGSRDLMVKYSGGLPVLLHEVGDAVFWEDTDGQIQSLDAFNGIVIAAENVGRKYLDRQVYQAIKSKIYRSILNKIAKREGNEISRKKMLAKMSESEKKNFDNFLQKMKKLGVVKEGEDRGEYVFTNDLYDLYVRMEARKEEGVTLEARVS